MLRLLESQIAGTDAIVRVEAIVAASYVNDPRAAVIAGFKHTETAEAIAVRDMATGSVRSIERSEAREIKTGGTVMPDELTATLSPRQLADLIRYLTELGK